MNSPVSSKDVVYFFSIQVTSSGLMLISVVPRHWESKRQNWELPACLQISVATRIARTVLPQWLVKFSVMPARLDSVMFALWMLKTRLGYRPATCHRWGWKKGITGNVGYQILAWQLDLTEQCCKGNGVHVLLWHMFSMDHCAGWWGHKWHLFYGVLRNFENSLKAVNVACWTFLSFLSTDTHRLWN